ncbi:MAG: hypothetical protein ACD_62C00672G0004 [uncultured bacterium]|nr:MAG: hypothetical protein ACD_62C00672G0004 [uncultured bacterium]
MHILPDFNNIKELALSVSCMWVIFILSLLSLNFLVFKPTLSIIKERGRRTDGLEKSSRDLCTRTQLEQDRKQTLNEEIMTLGKKLREDILAKALIEKTSLLTKTRQETLAYLDANRTELTQQTQAAEVVLSNNATSLADDICRKLIQTNAA